MAFEMSLVFEVNVGMDQGSVLSPFHCCMLMSETIEGLRTNFMQLNESFESKGLKVKIGKTKIIVSGGITKDGMSKSKVDTCGVCSIES